MLIKNFPRFKEVIKEQKIIDPGLHDFVYESRARIQVMEEILLNINEKVGNILAIVMHHGR